MTRAAVAIVVAASLVGLVAFAASVTVVGIAIAACEDER